MNDGILCQRDEADGKPDSTSCDAKVGSFHGLRQLRCRAPWRRILSDHITPFDADHDSGGVGVAGG